MGNCLVTKLKEIVQNDTLLKPGEIRVKVSGTGELVIYFSEAVNYDVDGVPQTPSDRCLVQVANSEKNIAIYNKYKITEIYYQNGSPEIEFNIDGLDYSPSLSYISFGDATKVTGDLGALKNKTGITDLSINSSTAVTGDLSDLAGLANATGVGLEYCNISGNLNSISGLSNLTSLHCGSPKIEGALSSLPNSIRKITLHSPKITGNLSSIPNLNNIDYVSITNCSQIQGEVTDWLAYIFNDLGVRDRTLTLKCRYTGCTFNQVECDENTYICVFSTSGIAVKWAVASENIATYDGTDWTFYR